MAKRKKKGAARAPAVSGTRRTVSIAVDALELARGHDGLLRGDPEPVVVIAALLCDPIEARVIGRAKVAFAVSGDYPVVSRPRDRAPLGLRARVRDGARVVVVAIAIEEDAGDGVAAAYAALGEPGAIAAWFEGAAVPEPRGLVDLASSSSSPMAGPARLVFAGADLGDLVKGDDFVGACVAVVDVAGAAPGDRVRLRFVDRDAKNDWTAVVDVRAS